MIDKSIVEQARNADMINFLERREGFSFVHQRGGYRCREHSSLAVRADRRSWYWHSKSAGGFGALDYLIKVEGLDFRQAVEAVAGLGAPTAAPPPLLENLTTDKTLILPEKSGVPLRLYDYLCVKRCIDGAVVHSLIQKRQLYEDKNGNVVFVGHDEQGAARFASVRGTYTEKGFRWDCAGSDKRYSFHMAACAPSDRLYIFESPIDCMSHASLINAAAGDIAAYKRHSRLSLAGTSDTALSFFLNQHKTVRELVLCLDNDRAGNEAAAVLMKRYADKGYTTRRELPQGKDFNEDLQAQKQKLYTKIRDVLNVDI